MKRGISDIKVLELGSTVTTPYATQALSALGAEVVKIEPPGGDPFRSAGVLSDDGVSGYFSMCNCGKKSIKLNLKKDKGREAFLDLAATADVVVENNRPGVVNKLGVDYDAVSDVNEKIVYCSISGYGQDGPWSQRAGFDPIIQGDSGLMSTTGEKGGNPVRIGVAVVDLMTAIWSALAIVNAVRYRDQENEGTYIDMSMFEVGLSLLTKRAAQFYIANENPQRMGTEDSWSAPYGAYETQDDRLLMIGAPWQRIWETLCELIERDDLIDDPRFATNQDRVDNRSALNQELNSTFRQKPLEEWLDILQDEIPAGRVATVEEALTNDHAKYRSPSSKVEYPGKGPIDVLNLPLRYDGERHSFKGSPPPEEGQHSTEILAAMYGSEYVENLVKKGVIPD
jgi:crotonobetainyl-CoA:carnitine CoA-transferase CaiB-like acyl-CoA transferase